MDTKSLKQLEALVKKFTSRSGSVLLTALEMRQAHEEFPEAYQKFKELRKELTGEARQILKSMAANGPVPYKKYAATLKAAGLDSVIVPGFTGDIDNTGAWFFNGERLNAAPTSAVFSSVSMNVAGTGTYIATVQRHDGGRPAHIYTLETQQTNSAAKYERVGEFAKKFEGIRKKWLAKVRRFDASDRHSVACVALEGLYKYAARQGSSEPGKGFTTVQLKHLSLKGRNIVIHYSGKDGIPTTHVVTPTDSIPDNKIFYKAILELYKNLTEEDQFLFSFVNSAGQLIAVRPTEVNKTLSTLGAPLGVTAHKLRTLKGTIRFQELAALDAAQPLPATKGEATKRYKEMVEEIGGLLNHKRGVGTPGEKVTGATAAKSYIDPLAQLALWDRWGYAPPATVPKV